MLTYDAILIDADDTLLDFRAAEKNAISEVIGALGIADPQAGEVYSRINLACWKEFERGAMTQAELRVRRFGDFLKFYGISADPGEVGERFTDALSRQGMLLPGALEAVRAIAEKLPVALVTNGISSVQHGRIDRSPIRPYISALVISGEQGFQKPDPRMIFRALELLGSIEPGRALMAGDSLTSDVLAANRAGVDACWYNPSGEIAPAEYKIRYEIRDIRELPDIALAEKF
ncbi:MAG: noncanonical pyrimidine nucleotidase, YjjG family [Clostridiales bacterium]|jgi:2-haloacid dehalogenase|nr:noncanonical pyrimidine nucleotidase, YjjG family [Clostridiales bacterium]